MAEAPVEDWRKLTPIPLILNCPSCGARHVDTGEFEKKVHRDHACQKCGLTWRAGLVPTVGVLFLPGYKNDRGLITKPCATCGVPVEDVDDPNFKEPWLCYYCSCLHDGVEVKHALNQAGQVLKVLARGDGPRLGGILDGKETSDLLCCSFCAKNEREVKSLVASAPPVQRFICNECIGLCAKLLVERDAVQRCATCNQPYKAGEATTCSNPFHLCRDCVYKDGVVVRSCANCDH